MRPEFFSDPTTSRLPVEVRLTYIGLWCVADDAGYLELDLPHIATMLYPYESIRVRTRRLERAAEELQTSGRLVVYPCGCALIPTLEDHQRIGGNKSFTVRDKHRVHTFLDKSAGRVGNGSNGRLEARERTTDEDDALRDAYRRQGLPV